LSAPAQNKAPLRPVRLGVFNPVVDRRPDGTIYLCCKDGLVSYPRKITERLAHWAETAPDRIFLAQRDMAGGWRTLTYKQVLADVRRIGEALLERELSPEKPIAILSGNDIEHALIALAAMYVGVPYAPISPAYSLMSSDFRKLRYIFDLLTPGLVFANDGIAFAHAIEAVVPLDVELAVTRNPAGSHKFIMFADLLTANAGDAVDDAHADVVPDTIAKILFTSGSTGQPKGVINTQRMLCANQAMLNIGLAFLTDEPPVIVDWLPWSHTFGGNHNFNMILNNGGSFYIDDGNPTPHGVPKTARNLREIAPTIYFNVPKGYETLIPLLRADQALRENFFRELKVLFYAGAGLNQNAWNDFAKLAVETSGERIVFTTSLGSTETAPAALLCTFDSGGPGNIGLPLPGVELKLVPNQGKLEARLRGPHITPGYWRQDALTKDAFDEEGFYKLGDALKFVDARDPSKGLLFDGRLAEDFKLATGTWVSVGSLRGRFIDHCAPFVRDVVVAGSDRDDIAVLVFPDVEAYRRLCPDLPQSSEPATVLNDARVRAHFTDLLNRLARQNTGSSTKICRAILLAIPPSIDIGEVTDKGSINQRAVLNHRAALVDELYRKPPSARVITIGENV
jgi:feruloyl-CoA synthase